MRTHKAQGNPCFQVVALGRLQPKCLDSRPDGNVQHSIVALDHALRGDQTGRGGCKKIARARAVSALQRHFHSIEAALIGTRIVRLRLEVCVVDLHVYIEIALGGPGLDPAAVARGGRRWRRIRSDIPNRRDSRRAAVASTADTRTDPRRWPKTPARRLIGEIRVAAGPTARWQWWRRSPAVIFPANRAVRSRARERIDSPPTAAPGW